MPGKVLKLLCGQTVLAHVIARLQACSGIDEIVVATTTAPHDASIAEEAARHHVKVFRGNEEDVLERYCLAARESGADTVVRATSDDPLLDPQVLSRMLELYKVELAGGKRIDYLSNNLGKRSYPLGLDVEVISMSALEKAHQEASTPSEREHVTPYIYQNSAKFILRNYPSSKDLSAHRWTLDTQEDWTLISGIYAALYKPGEIFTTQSVLDFLAAKPELMSVNAHVKQRQA